MNSSVNVKFLCHSGKYHLVVNCVMMGWSGCLSISKFNFQNLQKNPNEALQMKGEGWR
jgi:hypothetical protein